MSARVAVLVQEVKQVLTVPLQAVQERDAKGGGLGLLTGTRPVVFVVQAGKVEERALRPGRRPAPRGRRWLRGQRPTSS